MAMGFACAGKGLGPHDSGERISHPTDGDARSLGRYADCESI